MGSDRASVDAVIVGSGAGGAPLAAVLARAGLSVVILEAGHVFSPAEHAPDEAKTDLYWMEERLSGGQTPTAFGANNSGMGVGGSTLHWGAFCPRPDPRDFRLKSETGQGHDWPLSYSDVLPYLERVEHFIGVAGPAHYPWAPHRRYAFAPTARNAPAQAMERGCAALGIQVADAPAALLTRDKVQPDYGQRAACAQCGACHQGCGNAAKGSMDVTYLPRAIAHGARVVAGARVHTLEKSRTGRVAAVVYRQAGVDHRLRAEAVFLCAGGIETPRLLLHNGLANSSGQIGCNFMAHVATQVWGLFDADMRMNRGYPSSLLSEDFVRPRSANFAGGYLIQSLGVQPATLATTLARGARLWGAGLTDRLRAYNRLAGIGINGECLPVDENRLTLSDEHDAFGIPKARIDFSYHANEHALNTHASETLLAIWRAAGASNVFSAERSAHTLGTCRMGQSSEDAVVDSEGRSFDVPNLYVCDNSIFPSALSANPATTTMALGLRTAERFLQRA